MARHTTRTTLALLPLLALLAWHVPHAWAGPPTWYTVTDLGQTFATSLDDKETVAGSTFGAEQNPAILAPTLHRLSMTGGVAWGLNNTRVVGNTGFLLSSTPDVQVFGLHGFLWTAKGGLQDLGTAGAADLFSAALGVNRSGVIVGFGDEPTTRESRPGIFRQGVLQLLPTLGGPTGTANAVNSQGWIVGQSDTVAGLPHATLWVMGLPLDLDTTGGPFSQATAVNDEGLIVGVAVFATGSHAFQWTQHHGLQDLGVLAAGHTSGALGLNAKGLIVGQDTDNSTFPPTLRAVVWQAGVLADLNTQITAPGWTLEEARAINKDGVIVGQGRLNGQKRAFLLTPGKAGKGKGEARVAAHVKDDD
jgi:probable HAF family extracellular repeat protein